MKWKDVKAKGRQLDMALKQFHTLITQCLPGDFKPAKHLLEMVRHAMAEKACSEGGLDHAIKLVSEAKSQLTAHLLQFYTRKKESMQRGYNDLREDLSDGVGAEWYRSIVLPVQMKSFKVFADAVKGDGTNLLEIVPLYNQAQAETKQVHAEISRLLENNASEKVGQFVIEANEPLLSVLAAMLVERELSSV